MSAARLRMLERRLAEQLRRDRKSPSRCQPGPDETIIVEPSGTALGLAWTIGQETGEDDADVMNRVGNGPA
jgi:hypothetical protein